MTTQTLSPTFPSQVRLPGQTAAPDGPVDMLMMYLMHHAFRRDLAAFAAAVPVTPVADRAAWRGLHARWTGFANLLHHHHSGEDAGLWPLLLDRCAAAGDTSARETLDAMEAEHAGIDPLLAACEQGLRRMADGGTLDDRAALAVRTVATRDALGRHLEHEETGAIPIIQKYLTDADWRGLEAEYFTKPKRPAEVGFAVPWIFLDVPDDVRKRTLVDAGGPFGLVYALTRRRFARRHRAAFGYSEAAASAG